MHKIHLFFIYLIGDTMEIQVGDYVTRISHKHDMVFKVMEIDEDICYLRGVNVRLCADSDIDDLVKTEYKESDDLDVVERIKDRTNLDRDDYFYLPGKILHIDGDKDYLERCLRYYNNINSYFFPLVRKRTLSLSTSYALFC